MAAAVLEAVEHGDPAWRDLDIQVLPGITAMLAAAAACGAPLGHDFCAINLSDNMKPWALIDKRLRLAAEADFAMAFYNPRSKSRPEGFGKALKALQEACGDARPMIFARNVSRPDQTIKIVPLTDVTEDMADMRTVVLLGNSQTRLIERDGAPLIYTPRSVDG
jgi:precorrin-3B C17-methyltransferase